MSGTNSENVKDNGNPSVKKNAILYTISESINFLPEQSLLRNITNGKEVSLFNPASKCLEALINKQGNVLTQKELMYIGWEAAGAVVTFNAYYQNIANLRKALKEVSDENNDSSLIVKTIKRSGLIINSDVNIIVGQVNDSLELNNQSIFANINESHLTHFFQRQKTCANYLFICFSAILVVLPLYLKSHKKTFFDNYNYIKGLSKGCDLYLNLEANKTLYKGSLFDNKGIDCKGFNKVYVTMFPEHTRTSVLLCNDKMSRNSCISIYYASKSK